MFSANLITIKMSEKKKKKNLKEKEERKRVFSKERITLDP